MIALRLLAGALILVLVSFLIGVALESLRASPALAHSWYDGDCCSNQDCAPIPRSAVVEDRDGFTITLRADQHPSLTRDKTYRVPHDDARIRTSRDGEYHACIGLDYSQFEGSPYGSPSTSPPPHRLICFYRRQGWS